MQHQLMSGSQTLRTMAPHQIWYLLLPLSFIVYLDCGKLPTDLVYAPQPLTFGYMIVFWICMSLWYGL